MSLSLESDFLAIFLNAITGLVVAIGSVLVTFFILKMTLAKETKAQIIALERNLRETVNVSKNQIAAQLEIANKQSEAFKEELSSKITISDTQVRTQLKLVGEQNVAAHLLKVDEFRQMWINTFREDISELLRTLITLKDFYSVEEDLFISWDSLKRAERSRIGYYSKLEAESHNANDLVGKVRAKLAIVNNAEYKSIVEYEAIAKDYFERNKNEFKEYKELHADIVQRKTKILLMFNPNGTDLENDIILKINSIHQLLILGKRTFFPKGNETEFDILMNELQILVQKMLKIEWNRVRRLEVVN
ncbi:MAG: hypothetical protein V7749_16575 [Cocleimonas sp.]